MCFMNDSRINLTRTSREVFPWIHPLCMRANNNIQDLNFPTSSKTVSKCDFCREANYLLVSVIRQRLIFFLSCILRLNVRVKDVI